ncbi:MAG: hydrogenase maturation protease [Magnetococcales bacterium]|nr:hydrogenase maturation protease [Magnetococcales bacterium]
MVRKESPIQILVLGIGHIDKGDAGVGVHTVEILRRKFQIPPGIQVSDGVSMGKELHRSMAQARHIILVDALRAGAEPGSLLKLVGKEIPDFINHQAAVNENGLSSILSQSNMTQEQLATITLYGIEPADLDTGQRLSGEVAPQAERLANFLAEELERLGFSVPPRGLLSTGSTLPTS